MGAARTRMLQTPTILSYLLVILLEKKKKAFPFGACIWLNSENQNCFLAVWSNYILTF